MEESTAIEERSFYQALKEKYIEDQYCPSNFTVIKPKQNPKHKDAELAHLKTIVLNGSNITLAGICHTRRLSDVCPNVTDLDLAFNKLEEWREVVTILCHLPQLKYVNLSNNPLKIDTVEEEPKERLTIETLALNFTKIGIEDVLKLSDFLPSLKELQLCRNDYDHLGLIEEGIANGAFKMLESLTFYGNKIQKWSEIWKLRNFSNLKSLIVSENPLSDVFYREENRVKGDNLQEPHHSQNQSPRNINMDSDFDPSHQSSSIASSTLDDPSFIDRESTNFHDDSVTLPSQDLVRDAANSFLNEIIDDIINQSQPAENDNNSLPELDDCGFEISISDNTDKVHQNEIETNQNLPKSISTKEDVTEEPANESRGPIPDIQRNKYSSENQTGNLSVDDNNSNSARPEEGNETFEQTSCLRNSCETIETESDANRCDNTSDTTRLGDDHSHICTYDTSANTLTSQNDSVNVTEEDEDNNIQISTQRQPFNSLETLCLSNACISRDDELDALSCFPTLRNLRINCNQLYSNLDPDIRRQLYIASLPNVKVLNGSEISQTEREKAERHYLRHFMHEAEKPNSYHRLVSQHGPPVELVDIDLKAGFHEWANLTFIYQGQHKFSKKVRVFDSIAKLRLLISQTLNLHKRDFVMYLNPCNPIHPEYERDLVELRCENLPMSRLNLSDGDEIHIDKKKFNPPVHWAQKK